MLGCLRAVQGERIVSRFRSRKTAALLARLAYFGHRTHPRGELVESVWQEYDPASGRVSLRTALSSLRRQLEPPGVPHGAVIRADRAGIRLNPAAYFTDVSRFQEALGRAGRAQNPAARIEQLAAAAEVYRGDLLPGFVEEWVLLERQYLMERASHAFAELVALLWAEGKIPHAIQWARRAVSLDPLREEAHQMLLELLVADGQPEAAIRQYQELERLLREDLREAPRSAIRALLQEMEPLSGTSSLPDLGKRPAIPRPPTLDQVELPPASRAPDAAAPGKPEPTEGHGSRGRVPMQFTRFFGREQECRDLTALLLERHARLVTLTGPGGIGKSRLALELAGCLRSAWSGGVWHGSFTDVTTAPGMIERLQTMLRLPRRPGIDPLEQVVAFLAHRPTMVVLDNFDQLVVEGEALLLALLTRVEPLTLLVTSRKRLSLSGEHEFPVPALPVPLDPPAGGPDPRAADTKAMGELARCASVALFVDRSQAVVPDFQLTAANVAAVTQICRRLEGMPLALELAATHTGEFTPAQILARLEQRFDLLIQRGRTIEPRHHSLRAALDWSFHLLPSELQQFFARLSVFRSGWTQDAAGSIGEVVSPRELLSRLRSYSLIQIDLSGEELRYDLLETLKEHAEAQLAPVDRSATRQRHAEHYLSLAEEAEPELLRAAQATWLERLEQEHDNLRAALEWALESQQPEVGLRIAGALREFWELRVHWREGWEWATRLLAQTDPSVQLPVRAKALRCAGTLALYVGEAEAEALFAQCLALCHALGDHAGIAASIHGLGFIAMGRSDWNASESCFRQSLEMRRQLGDGPGICSSLQNLAFVYNCRDDHDAAEPLYAESLGIWREMGYPWGLDSPLHGLAAIAYVRGELDLARGMQEEALTIRRCTGDLPGIIGSLFFLARIAKDRGEFAAARQLAEESLSLCRSLGNRGWIASRLDGLGCIVQAAGDPRRAAELFKEALVLYRELASDEGTALSLIRLAGVAGSLARWEQAAQLLGTVDRLLESVSTTLGSVWWLPFDRYDHERHLSTTRSALTEAAYVAAFAAGRRLDPQEAVEVALQGAM
jgi:predicted ATPase/DNA-binding SARP family transcriptional activator